MDSTPDESDTVERPPKPLFVGLVYNEIGQQADLVYIGGVPHYAIPDGDFKRHIESAAVDDVVLAQIKEQITSMQDEVVRGMLEMIGKDDIFTKAAIEASIRNLEDGVRSSDTNQWLPWLRLFGFRIVVDVHGQVVEIIYPTPPDDFRPD
jgi:hypothetical protein